MKFLFIILLPVQIIIFSFANDFIVDAVFVKHSSDKKGGSAITKS